MRSLYDKDFVEWALMNASLLREHRFEDADIENIVEELESLAISVRLSLSSHLTNLTTHLLKWQFQPERRSPSWRLTIGNSRIEIERLLRDSPSLRPRLSDFVETCLSGRSEISCA